MHRKNIFLFQRITNFPFFFLPDILYRHCRNRNTNSWFLFRSPPNCVCLCICPSGDSMSNRRCASQNQKRLDDSKTWSTLYDWAWPLLKCWIIGWLFDILEKVKINFETEIKDARSERMWSQAWNQGSPRTAAIVFLRNEIAHMSDNILRYIKMHMRWYQKDLFVKIINPCHSSHLVIQEPKESIKYCSYFCWLLSVPQ